MDNLNNSQIKEEIVVENSNENIIKDENVNEMKETVNAIDEETKEVETEQIEENK